MAVRAPCGFMKINIPSGGVCDASGYGTNWVLDSGNPANVQNDLSSVLGVSNLLVPAEGVSEGKKLTFTADASGDYYVYVTNKKVEEVSAEIGERSLSFDNVDRGYFRGAGLSAKGTGGNPSVPNRWKSCHAGGNLAF